MLRELNQFYKVQINLAENNQSNAYQMNECQHFCTVLRPSLILLWYPRTDGDLMLFGVTEIEFWYSSEFIS